MEDSWKKQIIPLLPLHLQPLFASLTGHLGQSLEEIRFRSGQPLILHTDWGEVMLGPDGPVNVQQKAYYTTADDLQNIVLQMTEYSLYARDEELKRGYLALPGGHRAGFAGRVVMEENRVKLLRDISSINIRIARQIKGAGLPLLPHVYCEKLQRVRHTLIVSPPQAGKTTMLRDLARILSDGDAAEKRPGFKVGIVDERSEIAGCFRGKPQLDVGCRSDVLDGCPKGEGLMMLVRSMSPQVVVTDELGRAEDARAVEEAVNTGASVLATAHGQNLKELIRRPSLAYLLENGIFERIIFLSRRKGPGTIEGIYSGDFIQEWLRTGGKEDVDKMVGSSLNNYS